MEKDIKRARFSNSVTRAIAAAFGMGQLTSDKIRERRREGTPQGAIAELERQFENAKSPRRRLRLKAKMDEHQAKLL